MTSTTRAALDQEIAARTRYTEGVRVYGPEQFMTRVRGGWLIRTWTGVILQEPMRKRGAIERVRDIAAQCSAMAIELRARLTLTAMDEERAALSAEERLAIAQAQIEAAYGRRRFRRTG
jgi:hypothetical protein